MEPLRIAPEDRTFLRAVARVAVANPFSSERAVADRALDGGPPSGRPERIAAAAAARLDALAERHGPLLARAQGDERDERDVLAESALFALYHRWAAAFDRLVATQEAAPDEPCAVPFADELLGALAARGFTRVEARESLALFFQSSPTTPPRV
jgi:hypothetical protein